MQGYYRTLIPNRLTKWSILRQENLVGSKAKISLFSCSK
ncbi:hypothetical protein PPHE_a3966 [Pseudoalteromonas phenolica O-BC30]|nr:hypothetical protein [Pseudoalteromonas phenolica O-BC30]